MMLQLVVLLALLGLIVSKNVPRAPGLASSNWPIAHSDTWNSDVSDRTGPAVGSNASAFLLINGESVADIMSIFELADPITLVQSHIQGYTWGSSVSSVFQLKTDSTGVSMINSFYRDFNFEYHGAYCLLGADGTYFAAARSSLQAYNNEKALDFTTPIVKTNEYFVSGLDDDEHIVGLTMTHDDAPFLIFATTKGQVGAVSVDFSVASPLFRISGIEKVGRPDKFVSNSIGMDGPRGGIYVVTSISMNRLQWDPLTRTISSSWSTEYGTGNDDWYYGRLGPGAGTSPTISGPSGEPEYVVITDGENPMSIRYFDVTTGAEAGKQVVMFGCTAGAACNSTTDQSVVVSGYKSVVVQNYVAPKVTAFCSEWFASLPVTDALKMECPYMFGAYVNGVEQFDFNPRTRELTSVWANPDVSCTSSIPVVSEESGILYCLGKRERPVRRATYTIEAMSWKTGRSLFHVELSPVLLANSLYAATEVGNMNDIVMGTLAGIVRVSENKALAASAAFSATSSKRSVDGIEQAMMELMANSKHAELWQQLDEMQQMNERGEIPSPEFVKGLKLKF
jgi:hypothetical protein